MSWVRSAAAHQRVRGYGQAHRPRYRRSGSATYPPPGRVLPASSPAPHAITETSAVAPPNPACPSLLTPAPGGNWTCAARPRHQTEEIEPAACGERVWKVG